AGADPMAGLALGAALSALGAVESPLVVPPPDTPEPAVGVFSCWASAGTTATVRTSRTVSRSFMDRLLWFGFRSKGPGGLHAGCLRGLRKGLQDGRPGPLTREASAGMTGAMTTATDTYTVQQFLADARATIKTKGVPRGLAEVRGHLERLLANPELLKEQLGDPPRFAERSTIAYDPETDIHVLVHGREKGGQSVPHDHGPCWVVYGAYRNATRMRRWRRLDGGTGPGHAELEVSKDWPLEPGNADAFAPGDIHSIEYP